MHQKIGAAAAAVAATVGKGKETIPFPLLKQFHPGCYSSNPLKLILFKILLLKSRLYREGFRSRLLSPPSLIPSNITNDEGYD